MGRLAVVSGGGTGLGRAIARALASNGDEVVVVGRRAALLDRAAAEINAELGGAPVRAVAGDLTDPAQVARVAQTITAAGEVDVLVNNAGGNVAPRPATDLAGVRADWLANVTGNVLPAVLLTEALLPGLRRPGARIVTISSVAAVRGPAAYGGAKAALHVWSNELAVQLAPAGVTVNVVAPGYLTGTEFYGERMSPAFHESRIRHSPMLRGGDPDEVAATVCHLADPRAGFLTGQVILVDGGALLRQAITHQGVTPSPAAPPPVP